MVVIARIAVLLVACDLWFCNGSCCFMLIAVRGVAALCASTKFTECACMTGMIDIGVKNGKSGLCYDRNWQ